MRNGKISIGQPYQCCGFVQRKFVKRDVKDNENVTNLGSKSDDQPEILNYQQIMDAVKASKFFVLVDSAGSGKSAAFEDLAVKLKKKLQIIGLV